MTGKNLDSRCKAKTKKGKACRAAATDGGLCFFHANPNKAAELGRIGGRSKGWVLPDDAKPLPTLNSAVAVRDTVDRLIADVYAGKLHPRIATGLPVSHPFCSCNCAPWMRRTRKDDSPGSSDWSQSASSVQRAMEVSGQTRPPAASSSLPGLWLQVIRERKPGRPRQSPRSK
jgi:hypothetical protein